MNEYTIYTNDEIIVSFTTEREIKVNEIKINKINFDFEKERIITKFQNGKFKAEKKIR